MTNEATAANMRTIAEALGWEVAPPGYGSLLVRDHSVDLPGSRCFWLHHGGEEDIKTRSYFLMCATAELARRGFAILLHPDGNAAWWGTGGAPMVLADVHKYEPTSVESTVAAGLAACAEAAGMIGGGT